MKAQRNMYIFVVRHAFDAFAADGLAMLDGAHGHRRRRADEFLLRNVKCCVPLGHHELVGPILDDTVLHLEPDIILHRGNVQVVFVNINGTHRKLGHLIVLDEDNRQCRVVGRFPNETGLFGFAQYRRQGLCVKTKNALLFTSKRFKIRRFEFELNQRRFGAVHRHDVQTISIEQNIDHIIGMANGFKNPCALGHVVPNTIHVYQTVTPRIYVNAKV